MGSAASMIGQARGLLGTTERPPGSNHNKVTEFFGFDGPWCDMSIHFEAAHSDNSPAVLGKFANTVAHARAFKERNRWHYGLGGARPGDVVFFDWSGTRVIDNIDHVGLIEAVHSNGTITTLDWQSRRRRTTEDRHPSASCTSASATSTDRTWRCTSTGSWSPGTAWTGPSVGWESFHRTPSCGT